MNTRPGKVYLVGAGLGNIAYFTVRGKQLLSQAEVLIYDALVDTELLDLVPQNCLKLDVGKRGGLPSTPQETINQFLVTYCLQRKQVVRLKSGDPLIFGRANPEIQALKAKNCAFELVPGISSAIAAPLLAGIPLTDKDLSRCFAVLSAHEPALLDWSALARIDTLVILMGGKNLPEIVRQLQANGRSLDESVAIIRQAGHPQQQVWVGTLADIVDRVAGISLSPAVIIIGAVVNLRTMSDPLPLSEKTVLITRAAEQSSQFTQLLQQQGATVIEMPALEICPPSSWAALDDAIEEISRFDWLILTSANGVEYFFRRLVTLGKDARALAGVKIAVVGKKTEALLRKYGLRADFVPPVFVADSLVTHFPESLTHKNILFPRVETGGRDTLVKELTAKGAKVSEVSAYQSVCPDRILPEVWEALTQGKVDVVTFASSKTVQNFAHLMQQALKNSPDLSLPKILEKVCLASIGPQTSKTCQEIFGRVDLEAAEFTLEGLTNALVLKAQLLR